MKQFLLSFAMLFATSGLAYAQQSDVEPSALGSSSHWIMTLLGMAVAGRLAAQAFNRPSVPIADLPTFPKHMTSRLQYRLGAFIFVLFACSFFSYWFTSTERLLPR